jgi:Zn-dependent membrane protease YugP
MTVYYSYDIFYILTIILFFVSMICSGVVRSRFNRYSKDRTYNGMTGAMAAERILRANGIMDVTIVQTAGTLTDNYNPTNHTLNLSQSVYGGQNISAVAVAAHECGHAIQHAQAYPLLMLRKALVPVCNIGSIGSYIAILLGIFFSRSGLITLGAVLFSGIVLFNLVTLPVEVDASRRAMAEVDRLGLLTDEERIGGRKVLFAAGMTYFISLMTSIVQLLRLLSIANSRRR